jgi:hypothetical protein
VVLFNSENVSVIDESVVRVGSEHVEEVDERVNSQSEVFPYNSSFSSSNHRCLFFNESVV